MSEVRRKGKDLLNHMDAAGLLEYGSVITGDEVRSVLGIELPRTGSLKTFQRLQLLELAAVDYVRNILLGDWGRRTAITGSTCPRRTRSRSGSTWNTRTTSSSAG